MSRLSEIFGTMVFNETAMRERLPKETFRALKKTMDEGSPLDQGVANIVANAMKDWAVEKGATHFTHWFQPMTGITAEKHDSFITTQGNGTIIMEFSEIGKPIQVHNNTAFVFAADGFIYIGEFNNDKECVTRNDFSYNSTYHSAIVTKYRSGNLSLPELVYSIGNEIQGFSLLTDGTIVLSQSYGLASSRFLIYEPAQQIMTGRTMHGAEVCFLGKPTRIIQAPPMSEDLDVRNGNLIYMTESACKKYIFGNLYFDWNIYELNIYEK